VGDFDSQSSNYPDVYLPCRDWGHQWRPYTATALPGGSVERVLACGQCGTQRTQVVDPEGYLASSGSYGYAEGYLMHNVGRMTRDRRAAFRLASTQQLLSKGKPRRRR
jgi:hypothetical protein